VGRAEVINPGRLQKLLKTPGYHMDGAGLRLVVNEALSARWVLRYMVNGRSRDMGLGSYNSVSLKVARQAAREAREKIEGGLDPIDTRRVTRANERLQIGRMMTFRECVEAYIKAHRKRWKSDKHAAQWPSTLKAYAFPIIGELPVSAIDIELVLRVLLQKVGPKGAREPLWEAKPVTANRVRGRIELVLGFAAGRRLRPVENPARWQGLLQNQLAKPSDIKPPVHHPALHYRELPAFFTLLRKQNGLAAKALELTILTGLRTSNVIAAPWSEVDIEGRLWSIPATRMKAKRDHNVPLSRTAIYLLKHLPSYESRDEPDALLFPGAIPGRPLSNMAMLKVLERMGRNDVTVHGFRSTFRDWVSDVTNHHPELGEMALAHAIKNANEASYRRSDMFEKRLKLMGNWASYCRSAL
jgi:integrase